MVTTRYFGAFGTTAFWADDHAAESRTCALSIIGTACTAPLPFCAFLSGKKSLMAHGFMTFRLYMDAIQTSSVYYFRC